MYIVRNFTLWITAKAVVARGLISHMNTSCPPWCTAHEQPSTDAHASDAIAVPGILRAFDGAHACQLEVGLVADEQGTWIWIESTDGSTRLVVEPSTFTRLSAAVAAQL